MAKKRNKKLKVDLELLDTDLMYISGPMSGKENWNIDLFNTLEDELNAQGYKHTYNPARMENDNHQWKACLKTDIKAFIDNDITAVILLPGWDLSKGASLEVYIAQAFDAELYLYDAKKHAIKKIEVEKQQLIYNREADTITDEMWDKMAEFSKSTEPTIKLEDIEIDDGAVSSEEKEAVGYDPILEEANHIVNGARQNDYGHPLDNWSKTAEMFSVIFGVEVTAEKAAMALITAKICRHLNADKRDNLVDIAGYAEVINMITSERKRRNQ